jgi:glycosyltransferase involved in cell wall biosynthesis
MSSSEKNVLLLTQYLGMGGLERVILNLAKGMRDGGRCKPVVFVYDAIPEAPTLHDDFRELGIEVITMKKEAGFSWDVVRELARVVKSHRISVIHSHDLSALIYAVFAKWASLFRVRVVNTQHSFVHINNGPLYKYYERFFTFFADTACAVSESLRRQYAEVKIDPERVRLVENGMDFPEKPLTSRAAVVELRRKLLASMADREAARHLEDRLDWTWLLCMARIHPGKGQDHVLDVWNKLEAAEGKRVALIYLGQESAKGELAKLLGKINSARSRENVIYAGFTKKPSDWRLASDIFVSGSEFEGMPLGPIEALGAGIPVFLSDIPGHSMLPEHVTRFRLDDKAEGAHRLERLISQVSTDFEGSRARAWVEGREVREKYGIPRMTTEYERYYLGGKGASS